MQQLQCDTAAAPGSSRVRALSVLHADMLDQVAACWMIDYLHRTSGKTCPHCGVEIIGTMRLERWYSEERIKCSSPDCGRFYTSRTGTALDGSTLTIRELFLLKCFIEAAMPAALIVTIIPINADTVARWAKRFQSMEQLSA